ncbi:MAG: response regulator [Elusimicrobia bacterium]|nr:response regulator [Elusimicrobiota bacterium]
MAKILVVDDEVSLTEILRECLQGEGHDVAVCRDSTAAERAALEENPDLALIDYQMPRKTGVQVLSDLRARKETRLLPVLLISGTEAVRFAAQIPPEPRVRFLLKPLDMEALVTMVREMLDPNSWSAGL